MVKEMYNFERSEEHSDNSLTFSLVESLWFLWKAYSVFPPSMFELMFDTNRSDLVENWRGGKGSYGVNS